MKNIFTVYRPTQEAMSVATKDINTFGWGHKFENAISRFKDAQQLASFIEEGETTKTNKLLKALGECLEEGSVKPIQIKTNVEKHNLEQVFQLTQNGETPWMEREEVITKVGGLFSYSSMTGDVILHNESGRKFIVAMFGFVEVK